MTKEPDSRTIPSLEHQSIEYRKGLLVRLSKEPLIADDCIAYHGTSIETVQVLLQRGIIPGCTNPQYAGIPEIPQIGDVYFTPSDTFPNEVLPDGSDVAYYGTDYAASTSEGSAERNARGHRFLTVVGLPIEPYSHVASNLVDEYEEDSALTREARSALASFNLTEEEIRNAVEAARKRKGVVIGLSKSVLGAFPITEGDCGDDFRVQTGLKGLGIEFLTAIKPLGEEEKEFFDNLQ